MDEFSTLYTPWQLSVVLIWKVELLFAFRFSKKMKKIIQQTIFYSCTLNMDRSAWKAWGPLLLCLLARREVGEAFHSSQQTCSLWARHKW